jgi:predicted small secreted protein
MRRFTLFFILVLALSLALVACGGDDGGASE